MKAAAVWGHRCSIKPASKRFAETMTFGISHLMSKEDKKGKENEHGDRYNNYRKSNLKSFSSGRR